MPKKRPPGSRAPSTDGVRGRASPCRVRYHPGVRPAPPVLANDDARVEALRDQDILDTPAERDFDDIARLAAAICDTPMSAVTFIDADRQWSKAALGLDVPEVPREDAFCAHAIADRDVLVVPDALADDRFATNPMVVADPSVRFYAGAPVVTADGHALGTVCVLDSRPRALGDEQLAGLQALARQVAAQLELRRALAAEAAAAGQLVAAMAAPEAAASPPVPQASPGAASFARAVAVAAAAIAVAAVVLLDQQGSGFAKAFSDVMFVVASAAAAGACLRRGARTTSKGWRWLGAACATWSVGAVAWSYFGLTRDHTYPFPSLADVGFVGYVVPALVGLWRLRARAERWGKRLWRMLDGAVIAAMTLFVSWGSVLGPLVGARAGSAWEHALLLAYPVVDVAVFSAVLAFGLRQRGAARRSWALLALGFATLAVTDST